MVSIISLLLKYTQITNTFKGDHNIKHIQEHQGFFLFFAKMLFLLIIKKLNNVVFYGSYLRVRNGSFF